jgi:trans-aconitate 2-methyltransferase
VQWDPVKYRAYDDERSRPFVDLVARIDAATPRHVVDLGCGPGTLTALLAARWPGATVEGIDSSPEMIDAATSVSGVTFRVGDIVTWRPDSDTDVVVSNAALQWVPDHLALLQKWAAVLPTGAWLAWQVPGNFDSPSHVLMRSLAESTRWADRLSGVLRHRDGVAPPQTYASVLLDSVFSADVWETTYLHVLDGSDPVLEWLRGTGLRPILAALTPDEQAAFETEYAAALRQAYPATDHGTLFPFRRIFAVGQKR